MKKQQEENAARKRSLEDLKRELENLEELKKLNAARARLQVYDENEVNSNQDFTPQNFDVPTAVRASYQINLWINIHNQREVASRNVTQESV